MATIKYLIQGSTGLTQIYLRMSISKKLSIKRKTGLLIDPKKWSPSKGLPISRDEESRLLIETLHQLVAYVIKDFNEENSKGTSIDGVWLQNSIDKFFGRNKKESLEFLVPFTNFYLESLEKRNVTDSTKRKYRTIVKKLQSFEEVKKKRYLIKDVNLAFRDEFVVFLREHEYLNENTTGRYLKFVKTIVLEASKNQIAINDQITNFKGFTKETPKIILSIEELHQIKNKNLVNTSLLVARDWLIIGFFTGQRVSDLLRMNKTMIQIINGYPFIVLKQVKTKSTVQIPIHPEVKEILARRDGQFPPVFSNKSDSNSTLFNRYLKDLAKEAQLNTITEGYAYEDTSIGSEKSIPKRKKIGSFEKWKLISSHICRRSFASYFYGQPNYPTPLLMNITSHKSERQFLNYIGKKPIDYSIQLAKIWQDNG